MLDQHGISSTPVTGAKDDIGIASIKQSSQQRLVPRHLVDAAHLSVALPQPMPFAFLGTRSPCQIPVAAVPLNGKSTALLTESADPQGQMAVGRSTERRDDLLRPSYAGLQQRLVRSVSCSTAQLFCAQGLLSQPALGLPHNGCAITNLS